MARWRKSIGLFILLGTVAAVPCLAGPAAQTSRPALEWKKGREYAENHLFIDAVESFSRAIRLNTGEIDTADVAAIFNSRGLAYLALNEPDKALDDFSNAIELDEKNTEYYLNRASLLAKGKEYDKAQLDYAAAVKLNPRGTEAYAGRGMIFLENGDLSSALADFEKVLERDPRNTAALYSMGIAFKRQKRSDKALEAFNMLLKIDPRYAAASYQIAGIYARSGKIDAACVWLEEAVSNGFRDRETMENDPDLASMRKVDCYRRVLSGRP